MTLDTAPITDELYVYRIKAAIDNKELDAIFGYNHEGWALKRHLEHLRKTMCPLSLIDIPSYALLSAQGMKDLLSNGIPMGTHCSNNVYRDFAELRTHVHAVRKDDFSGIWYKPNDEPVPCLIQIEIHEHILQGDEIYEILAALDDHRNIFSYQSCGGVVELPLIVTMHADNRRIRAIDKSYKSLIKKHASHDALALSVLSLPGFGFPKMLPKKAR